MFGNPSEHLFGLLIGKKMIIAIIGVGLIGGSIGLALKKFRIKNAECRIHNEKQQFRILNSEFRIQKIIGIGRNISRLKVAKKLGAVDEVTTDIKKGVENADVIFICLPVSLIAKTVKNILPFCKINTIITDVGSVKAPIVKEIEGFLVHRPSSIVHRFIGGHPIAGSEKTSVRYASKSLFKNVSVILTPAGSRKTCKKPVKVVKKLWEKMGAKVNIMSPSRHDNILSFASHLPHVAAFSLVNTVNDLRFTGSGFIDTTRIAASDPGMWADIIFHNRTNVRKAIKKFKSELSKIEKAKSKEQLIKIFKKAKMKRNNLCHKIDNSKINEADLLQFVKISLKRRKIPPTVRETASYFNIAVSTAHLYLKNLYYKKLITERKSQHSNRMVARGISTNKD